MTIYRKPVNVFYYNTRIINIRIEGTRHRCSRNKIVFNEIERVRNYEDNDEYPFYSYENR